jgi:hypothetical protein
MKLDTESTKVKSVSTKNFSVSLMKRLDGNYYVDFENSYVARKKTADFKDYAVASALFNMLITEMEGN